MVTLTCFKYNKVGHFASVCRSSSTQNTWQFNNQRGRGRAPRGRGFTSRQQVNKETEMPESSVTTNDKSDLDVVRLMEAYGLVNTSPQTSLKKRVQIDNISISFEQTANSLYEEFTVPVLHGAPI